MIQIYTIRIIFGNSPVKFVNKSDARHTVSFHLSVNRQCLTLEFRKKNDIITVAVAAVYCTYLLYYNTSEYIQVQNQVQNIRL